MEELVEESKSERAKRVRQRNMLYVDIFKFNSKCKCCDAPGSHKILTFHHLKPSKKIASVSEMIMHGRTLTKIKNEIDKCELLCESCHRWFEQKKFKKGLRKYYKMLRKRKT